MWEADYLNGTEWNEMNRMKKKKRVGVAWAIFFMLSVVFYVRYQWVFPNFVIPEKPVLPVVSLQEAPPFELFNAEGKKYSLQDLRGTVTVLHFWASWCPPCLEEIPQWVQLGSVFKDRGVKLVAISLDRNWEDLHKILPQRSYPEVISLLDPLTRVSDAFGSYQFPETYLLNKDLQILSKWVGPQNWANPILQQAIERALVKE